MSPIEPLRLHEADIRSRVQGQAGPQQYVPESMFDDSIKLVVWGHEHDCRIWPEKVEGKVYYITQPGSSVATSLAPAKQRRSEWSFSQSCRVDI